MTKTIAFKQPTAAPAPAAEAWINPRPAASAPPLDAPAPVEPTKRLTVELPESLHTRLKMQCVRRRRQAYELIGEILEKAVTELEAQR